MTPRGSTDTSVSPLPKLDLGLESIDRYLDSCLTKGVPSLLFSGPAGTGKEYTAIEFARKLCCERSPACDPAGEPCDSCRAALRLEHPGIHLIYPTPTRGTRETEDDDLADIDKILAEKRQDIFATYQFSKKVSLRIAKARAIIKRAHTKPFMGRYNVFILADAHTMREEAQNALLKLVEEPPPRCVLIVLTVNADAILYTIRSRCQQVRFGPLTAGVIETTLREYYGIEADAARRAAALARGSIQQARQYAAEYDNEEKRAAAELVLQLDDIPPPQLIGRAMAISRGSNRDRVARFLHELELVFRDIMTGDESLYFNLEYANEIGSLAARWDRKRIPGILERIRAARDNVLRRNMNIDATLANLFLAIKRPE